MPKINYRRGFTLIELLVVIAIIGILSGIVLTFINSARLSAKDSRIKTNVKSIKTQLEIGFDGSKYIDLRTSNIEGSNIPAYLFGIYQNPQCSSFGSSEETCQTILALEKDTVSQGGEITYRVNAYAGPLSTYRAHAFAVYGKLSSDPSYYFCADSTGKILQKTMKAIYTACTQ